MHVSRVNAEGFAVGMNLSFSIVNTFRPLWRIGPDGDFGLAPLKVVRRIDTLCQHGYPGIPCENWARHLLAVEAANQCATDAHAHEAVRVCEKLRIALIRLCGSDGFASLLRRTLALARRKSLRSSGHGQARLLHGRTGRASRPMRRAAESSTGRDHGTSARTVSDVYRDPSRCDSCANTWPNPSLEE